MFSIIIIIIILLLFILLLIQFSGSNTLIVYYLHQICTLKYKQYKNSKLKIDNRRKVKDKKIIYIQLDIPQVWNIILTKPMRTVNGNPALNFSYENMNIGSSLHV